MHHDFGDGAPASRPLARRAEDRNIARMSIAVVTWNVKSIRARRERLLAFLARRGATGPAFLKDEADEPFMTAFSPAAADWDGTLPATFLYDAKGRRLALFEGATTHAALTDTVRALLSTL